MNSNPNDIAGAERSFEALPLAVEDIKVLDVDSTAARHAGTDEDYTRSRDLDGGSTTMGVDADHVDRLAELIRVEHDAVVVSLRRGLDHAIVAGHALNKAKKLAGHGNWLSWLNTNCPFLSERTAQNYMRLASQEPTLKTISATVADLTEREALGLLAKPKTSPKAEPAKPADGPIEVPLTEMSRATEPVKAPAKVRATKPGTAGHTHKSRPSGKSSILERATALVVENERLNTELAIATESLHNVTAEFETFRNAASSEVGLPPNAASIPPAVVSLEAPAETDLELPAFLDRRLTEELSEVDLKAFVALAAAWRAFTCAWANASATVRKLFETVVPGSAQARNG